ncbi:MAG TPA: alpha/beta fold hydrolase [Longimicrobiales bacterium]|nr:alpha/beta fold hydrolase [Longimicrobiales bacterium]
MKDDLLEVDGGPSLRVRVGGEGPGLLLLHGFASGIDGWPPGELERLSRTRRVVAPDLPGHGASGPAGPGDATPERLVAVVDAVRRRYLEGHEVTILGYSMGARLALTALARRLPIDRLLLESPNPGLEAAEDRATRTRWDDGWADRFASEPTEAVLDAWLDQPIFATRRALPPEAKAHQRRVRYGADGPSLATFLREFGTGRMPPTWDALSATGIPLRILVGARDTRYVELAARIRACGSDVEVTVVEGVGHAPHMEAAGRWGAWVDATAPGLGAGS